MIIVDDLLATGGTMMAATKLIENLGGEISGIITLIELTGTRWPRSPLKIILYTRL